MTNTVSIVRVMVGLSCGRAGDASAEPHGPDS